MENEIKNVFLIVLFSYLITFQNVAGIKRRSIDLISAHSLISDSRLPRETAPNSYVIKLQPYIEEGYFIGQVQINVSWEEESDKITLHADKNLVISEKVTVVQTSPSDESDKSLSLAFDKVPIKVIKVELEPKKPMIILHLEKSLNRGAQAEVKIPFNGTIDKNEALFRDEYIDSDEGVKKWYIASKFRPNLARKVFPCYDEPSYKTPISISVARTKDMITLSNMPVLMSEEKKDQPGWHWDHFQPSPPMSTFTLAFIVSEFHYLERNTTEEIDMGIKVWGRPDYLGSLKDVVLKTVKSMQVLREFWGTAYPLPKIDCVALPNFSTNKPGDNWGLLFFKESDLDNKKLSYVSQELAYQWLGSLATPFWWNDAHINYALNRYVTAYTTLKLNYKNESFNNWPMTMLYSIYYEFSKRYPHWKNTAIKQDSVSAKTEMIFRMLNYTLGESTFVRGLQRFMATRQFGTFFGDDIWTALTERAISDNALTEDMSVNNIAASWITKDRLPVVNATRLYDTNSVVLTQKVYLRERPHDLPDQDKLLWWIPIVLVREDRLDFQNSTPITWMKNERKVIVDNMPDNHQFIIVNPEEIGPFPVNYDGDNWNMISRFLLNNENRIKIPVNTRAKLLHDAWNLAYAGDLGFGTALNMTLFLRFEREYLAWDPIFTMIDHIGRHIDSSEVHKKFQGYIRHLLTPLYQELGPKPKKGELDGKTHLRRYSEVFLCQAGYKPCVIEAQKQYHKWMKAANPDEGNILADEYICPVFKYGTNEEWEFGLQRIINFPPSRMKNERTYLLKTLAGCPIDSYKIERLLNVTVLEENGNFTDTDINLIFSMLTGGASGYTTLFNFLEKNWDVIKIKFEKKPLLWNSLVTSATTVFKTQEGLDMVSGLYVERQGEFGTAEFVVERALKNIKEETKWSDENLPVIEKWLDNYLKENNVDLNVPSS
ncbi:aminopeptidase N [Onthophagus taurus]|uniref:aminopeptidase N n=1 Tax=Onthophagus taurus TaxID=166361 RepID=UPI0039BE7E72